MDKISEDTPFLTRSAKSIFGYVIEASDLGLRAGEWPQELQTTLGNKQPFIRTSKKLNADGELLWVTYHQVFGCIYLRIFND